MATRTTVNTVSTSDTDVVVTSGAMDASTMVCSAKIVVTAEGPLRGQMGPCTKENSGRVSVKVKDRISLVTEDDMKEAGRTDVTTATVFVSGKMADVTRGSGSTGWLTARESKPLPTDPFGTMDNGLKMNPCCNFVVICH